MLIYRVNTNDLNGFKYLFNKKKTKCHTEMKLTAVEGELQEIVCSMQEK
jgi:hypothetical protein